MKSPQRGWIGVLVFLGILLAIYLPFMLAKPRPAPVQLPAAASAALSAFSASDERGQVGMVPDIAAYRLTFSSPDASVSALTGKDFDTVSMGVDGLQLNGAWEVLDAALTRSGRKAVAVTLVLDGSALGQAWIISPYPEDSTFIAYTRRDAAQVYDRLVFRK